MWREEREEFTIHSSEFRVQSSLRSTFHLPRFTREERVIVFNKPSPMQKSLVINCLRDRCGEGKVKRLHFQA